MCAFLALLCISGLCFGTFTGTDVNTTIFQNDVRHFLLLFKDTQPSNDLNLHPDIPLRTSHNTNPTKKRKKRGSRGGVLERLKRRGSRFPLPTITLTNCRALNTAKQEELRTLVEHDYEFRRCNLMCLTETWLDETKSIDIPGFTAIRNDRDNQAARKKGHGGGVCMLVSDRWATNFTVRDRCCTHDYEALSVSFRPFYLPREFSQATVILAYFPGQSAEGLGSAGEWITEAYHKAIAKAKKKKKTSCVWGSPTDPKFLCRSYNFFFNLTKKFFQKEQFLRYMLQKNRMKIHQLQPELLLFKEK